MSKKKKKKQAKPNMRAQIGRYLRIKELRRIQYNGLRLSWPVWARQEAVVESYRIATTVFSRINLSSFFSYIVSYRKQTNIFRQALEMPEKKGEMSTNGKTNPKKANLFDHNSIKHILDESVSEVYAYFSWVHSSA